MYCLPCIAILTKYTPLALSDVVNDVVLLHCVAVALPWKHVCPTALLTYISITLPARLVRDTLAERGAAEDFAHRGLQ